MIFPVSPEAAISGLSTLCVFLIKTIAAYGCCWLLARFATSAGRRFTIWFAYLVGTGAFWLYSLIRLLITTTPTYSPGTVPAQSHSGVTYVLPSQFSIDVVELASALLLAYLAVLGLTACVGLWRRFQLYRALRLRLAAPAPIANVFQSVAEEMRVPSCHLWMLPGLTSPATLGSLRPAVYLPADCQDQDSDELRNVLRHELKHVKRRDSLWEILCRISRFLLFFHPLVHRAFASTRFEREVACDMAVVRSCPEKRDLYAETLVRFGWKTAIADKPDYIGIGFTSAAAILNARVGWILTGEEIYSAWSRKGRALLSAGVLWLFIAGTPALWIAFRLAPTQQIAIGNYVQHAAVASVSRHALAHPALHVTTPATSLPPSAAISNPVVNAIHTTSDNPHYQIQNADEPMSNPTVADDPQPGDPNWKQGGSIANPHAPVPSATSVIIDTATQLSRMGVGRDHDRD